MADLISRAAAIEAIVSLTAFESEDELKKFVEKKACDDYYLGGLCDVIDEVKDIAAVDAAPVVRCAYCKHCFDMGSDPMEPYDGESEWYCARFDRDTSAYEIDPYRFFCADGERRDDDGKDDRM